MKMTLILSAAVCVLSLRRQARAQQAPHEKLTMSNGTRGEESSSAAAESQGPFQYSMVQTPPRNLSRTIDRLDYLDCLNG
jgi:hypothetical protein